MNIERQYKLYKLGIDIDSTYKKVFDFLHAKTKNLITVRSELMVIHYFNNKELLFQIIKDDLYVRYEGFCEILNIEYLISNEDIEDIFRFWIKKKHYLNIYKIYWLHASNFEHMEKKYKETL